MTSNTKLLAILDKQIEVEKRALDTLIKAEESFKETAVRLVCMDLRLDTWKHVKFLEGMIEMLTISPCDTWSAKIQRYVDRVKLERLIGGLVQEEDMMADIYGEALAEINDPITELLLLQIKETEERHSQDLKKIMRIIQTAPLQSVKAEKGSDIVCED